MHPVPALGMHGVYDGFHSIQTPISPNLPADQYLCFPPMPLKAFWILTSSPVVYLSVFIEGLSLFPRTQNKRWKEKPWQRKQNTLQSTFNSAEQGRGLSDLECKPKTLPNMKMQCHREVNTDITNQRRIWQIQNIIRKQLCGTEYPNIPADWILTRFIITKVNRY